MAQRDPFPMSSPEAQRLAASVEDPSVSQSTSSGGGGGWNTMALETVGLRGTAATNGSAADEIDAAERLVEGRKAKPGAVGDSNHQFSDADRLMDDDYEDDDDDRDDDFLDRSLTELRGSRQQRYQAAALRVLRKFYQRLYGDQLPFSEMLRSLCLATTLFFMIGGYWLLRSLKDPVITALCGIQVVPKAKMVSVFVVFGVVSIYNRLLDSDMPKHRLFYLFGTIYFGIFTIIALMLMDKSIGLPNQQANPSRLLGWISYCAIESFGSVMVSLFWSFANSNISLETAKASYGVMVATAQIGSIIGPTIVRQYAESGGVAACYLIGAFCMLLLQATMYMYIHFYGTAERNAAPPVAGHKKPEANIWEGLQLFWEDHYVKGIFAISCLFMVIETIVDYIMKVLATDFFAGEFPSDSGQGMSEEATAGFATFMGMFGQATNMLSFLLSLLGTSAVIRYLGLRLTLLLFPVICFGMAVLVRFQPTLYVVFTAMMILKACSYALNNPTKEMLYQPTSSAVRYKAKSWIDIFGGRGSKALGSVVTNAFSQSADSLIANGSLISMLVSLGLIWNARYMGKTFDEYMASGHIVGAAATDDHERVLTTSDNLEMATLQNDDPDTSCAILDQDDEVGPEEEGQVGGAGDEKDDDPDDDNDDDVDVEVEVVDDRGKPEMAMV